MVEPVSASRAECIWAQMSGSGESTDNRMAGFKRPKNLPRGRNLVDPGRAGMGLSRTSRAWATSRTPELVAASAASAEVTVLLGVA